MYLTLLLAKLEVLCPLDRQLLLDLAYLALQAQRNFLGRLCLLVEDRLGLTTVALLLAIVSALALGEVGGLACLVLRHLVVRVLAALLALAEGLSLLGNVHHTIITGGNSVRGASTTGMVDRGNGISIIPRSKSTASTIMRPMNTQAV